MKRQWFAAVILLSFLAFPAMAEEPETCPDLPAHLAEVASKHSEEVICQMPLSGGFLMVVTASKDGAWRVVVAEPVKFKTETRQGLMVKIALEWCARDMFYGRGGLKGPQGDDS